MSLSSYHRAVVSGHGGGVHRSRGSNPKARIKGGKEKPRSLEAPESHKEMGWNSPKTEREKVSDDGIQVAPVISVQCDSLTAFSAGYCSD